MKKTLLLLLMALSLALTALSARAGTCSLTTSASVISPPSLIVQRDLPVGSPVGNEVVSGQVQAFNCSNYPGASFTSQEFGVKGWGTYVMSVNGRRIYSTNVAGIGYAVGITSLGNCAGTSGYVNGTQTGDGNANNFLVCANNGLFPNQPITGQVRVQFYKTAQTTGAGTVNGMKVASLILRNNQQTWSWPESDITITSFNVTTIACSVTNTALSVQMGTVEKRAFSGPGTGPGDSFTRNLTIPLNCNAGTRVNVQIDGSAQDASKGVLNLTSGTGSATGVGIQLLYNNAPLTLSAPVNIGTATSEGTFNIPLQARYYQTGNNITPGTANANATFTVTYQ